MGLNAKGVFAAVTNLRCPEPDPDRLSRGLLVMAALNAPSAAEAALRLRDLPDRAYNPFNLLVADTQEAFLLSYRETPQIQALEPGVHVIGNTDPDDRDAPKVKRILELAKKAAVRPRESVLGELASVCREHDSPESPLGDTCVHGELYGTRSGTLLLLAEDEAVEGRAVEGKAVEGKAVEGKAAQSHSRFWFADGSPCRTEYRDFTSLLTELSHTARYGSGESLAREYS